MTCRIVPVENVSIGDEVTAQWTTGDVVQIRRGTVQSIRYEGTKRYFVSGGNQVIFAHDSREPRKYGLVVQLVKAYVPAAPVLF